MDRVSTLSAGSWTEWPEPSLPVPRLAKLQHKDPRRILVLALGGIGDTVLAFAAFRDLRRACPNDHLTALAMWPQAAELLADLRLFDEVHQHNFQTDRLHRSLRQTWRLRRERFDVSLLAFPTNRFQYNLLAGMLGARERWGHRYLRGHDLTHLRFLLTHTISQQTGRHTADENRALVTAFTGHCPREPADTRLAALGREYRDEARRMLEHLTRPLVGVHPGCSSYKGLAAKRWPIERFGAFCSRVINELGCHPLVFGMPDEIGLKLALQQICPPVHFAHGPSIRHTAALIAECAAFVSNDSALAHLASAAGVPTFVICGPTDPGEVGPYGHPERTLSAGLSCSPCFRVGRQPMCCTNATPQACLRAIEVDAVVDAVRTVLPSAHRPAALTQEFPSVAAGRLTWPSLGVPLPVRNPAA